MRYLSNAVWFCCLAKLDKAAIKSRFWALLPAQTSVKILIEISVKSGQNLLASKIVGRGLGYHSFLSLVSW